MNQNEILELISRFDKSDITKLEYEADGERLLLEKAVQLSKTQSAAVSEAPLSADIQPEQTPPASDNAAVTVKAPLVGVFYEAGAPGAEPFVKVGDKVSKGQLLCLIEAMKMINELPSPVSGIIKSVFVKNEDVVSFGQQLFEVELC